MLHSWSSESPPASLAPYHTLRNLGNMEINDYMYQYSVSMQFVLTFSGNPSDDRYLSERALSRHLENIIRIGQAHISEVGQYQIARLQDAIRDERTNTWDLENQQYFMRWDAYPIEESGYPFPTDNWDYEQYFMDGNEFLIDGYDESLPNEHRDNSQYIMDRLLNPNEEYDYPFQNDHWNDVEYTTDGNELPIENYAEDYDEQYDEQYDIGWGWN
ncbi:unnamed protein product [Caenorhabditis sp. 36 PRJEB53466]|nr:unnamed protein product [Caenorhabditis sp. 36 PRJEB53466]